MNRLPNLKPRELIQALEKLGFARTRKSKGGHLRYVHPDLRKTTVLFHSGRTIPKGLLVKIIKTDLEMNVENFISFLK